MIFRGMKTDDDKDVSDLWINTPAMGLNAADDSENGIAKYISVILKQFCSGRKRNNNRRYNGRT